MRNVYIIIENYTHALTIRDVHNVFEKREDAEDICKQMNAQRTDKQTFFFVMERQLTV